MRVAVINNDIVINIVESKELLNSNWIELPEDSNVSIGFVYKGDHFIDPDEVIPTPSDILISSVTGAISTSSSFSRIVCNELTNVNISGSIDIPDVLAHRVVDGVITIVVPLRRDDGRLILFPAVVTNGEFSLDVNLPTSGKYSYTNSEANIDLPENTFKVAPMVIEVLRNVVV